MLSEANTSKMDIIANITGMDFKRVLRKTMRHIAWYIGHVLASPILFIMRCMTRKSLHVLGKGIGIIWYNMITASRRLGHNNLDMVYGHSVSSRNKALYCMESFKNILVCMMDFYYFSFHTNAIMDHIYIDTQTQERIRSIVDKGQGALFFSAHLGNWELLASCMGRFLPMSLLSRNQKRFAGYIEGCRDRHGVNTLYDDSTIGSIKNILSRLGDGELVGIVLDRNLRDVRGIVDDFLGYPAFTPYYPVKLAMKAKVPVVGAFLVPEGNGYRLHIEEPVTIESKGDKEATYRHYTRTFLDITEKYILKHPDQWFWAHKRWGRPKGIVDF